MCAAKLRYPQEQKEASQEEITQLLEWLTSLASLDAVEAGKKMLETLFHLNGISQPPLQRYQQLITLHSNISTLIKKLEHNYLDSDISAQKPEGIQAAELTRKLLQETICGHNIIISELAQSDATEIPQGPLSNSLRYALRFESRYLMEHYLTYQPIGSDLWGELKLLYRYARQRKLERVALYDIKGIVQTVESAFIAVILFAAINPFRLSRSDIVNSYRLLSHWAHHCHLEACTDDWQSKGEWVIDLSSDRPPEYIQPKQKMLEASTLLVINIDKIIQSYQGKNFANDLHHGRLKQQLLDRLNNGWVSDPPRSYERRSSFQDMQLSIGLHDCHHLLISTEAELINEDDSDTLWSMHLANHWLEAEMDTEKNVIQEVQQIDVGIGGYGLRIPQQYSDSINKGDLVLLRHTASSNETWRVGQTRWKHCEDAQTGVILGICLLAEDCSPLIITNTTSENNGGLLLPCCDFDNPLASIILDKNYQTGDTIHCCSSLAQAKILLSKELVVGPDFKQFNFTLL